MYDPLYVPIDTNSDTIIQYPYYQSAPLKSPPPILIPPPIDNNNTKSGNPTSLTKCNICYENPSDAVLLECGHSSVCCTCAVKLNQCL